MNILATFSLKSKYTHQIVVPSSRKYTVRINKFSTLLDETLRHNELYLCNSVISQLQLTPPKLFQQCKVHDFTVRNVYHRRHVGGGVGGGGVEGRGGGIGDSPILQISDQSINPPSDILQI